VSTAARAPIWSASPARGGLAFTQLAENTPGLLRAALIPGKTKLVWIETPSNPLWTITNIAAFSEIAHRHGALIVVDNTVATPVLTRPIEHGADLVMHSATKYLNGHGDLLMGALVTKEEDAFWEHIRGIAHDGGALPGSFAAWLLLRGMRTLFLRMECICANAQRIAEFLDGHPNVARVHYPGLPGSEGYEVAKKQMQGGFGGMILIQVRGGFRAAVEAQARMEVFKRATSLGTTESLVEHRASYEGPGSPVPDDLLQLSIGIESVEDLLRDLERALD
jgi:cystathionine gamma-synthase